MELSFLMALPPNQRSLVPDGQPVVREIMVAEVEKQAEQHPSGSE